MLRCSSSFWIRILPKERLVKINLPTIEHHRDLTAAYAAIVQAVGKAELAPGEGSAVAALIANIAKFIDDAEVEARTPQPGNPAQLSASEIMIRRELKSQLIELEKRYAAAVKAKRDEETAPGRWARLHAVEVAAVVLYGEPKIAEPLSVAHLRMQEKLDKQFAAAADELLISRIWAKNAPYAQTRLLSPAHV